MSSADGFLETWRAAALTQKTLWNVQQAQLPPVLQVSPFADVKLFSFFSRVRFNLLAPVARATCIPGNIQKLYIMFLAKLFISFNITALSLDCLIALKVINDLCRCVNLEGKQQVQSLPCFWKRHVERMFFAHDDGWSPQKPLLKTLRHLFLKKSNMLLTSHEINTLNSTLSLTKFSACFVLWIKASAKWLNVNVCFCTELITI